MSRRKTKKYFFTLSRVDTEKVNKKYGIELVSNLEEKTDPPVNTTKLCELNIEKGTPEFVSFLDESKKARTCHVSMIDFTTGMRANMLRYLCFWCRHSFDTQGIGCPIRYVSNKAVKKYYSEISKDEYTINENVTSKRLHHIDDSRITIRLAEYYETDGIFCSFNCCQAYINNNKHNRMYDNSHMLLTKMYNHMMGTKAIVITPAPHWRMLSAFGGTLNIFKFREEFNKIEYKLHGTTKCFPKFYPVGMLFEQNIKF